MLVIGPIACMHMHACMLHLNIACMDLHECNMHALWMHVIACVQHACVIDACDCMHALCAYVIACMQLKCCFINVFIISTLQLLNIV